MRNKQPEIQETVTYVEDSSRIKELELKIKKCLEEINMLKSVIYEKSTEFENYRESAENRKSAEDNELIKRHGQKTNDL